jgi:light-regulated signal transduction histidine kinase (bacteriophytochrome)
MGVELAIRWTEALAAHLKSPGEETLSQAYELGRVSMTDGQGLIDLAAAHHQALLQLESAGALNTQALTAVSQFFAEAMGVFEMANRGYRDANAALKARNNELEAAKERIEATSRELEAFSFSVSHDLRAPLRSIEGFSQALEEDNGPQLDDHGKEHLHRVRAAAQRMSDLIDDLLKLARISREELTIEPVDLVPIARGVFERLGRAEPHRQVEVAMPAQLLTRGDPRLLTVALENLISNAWKFTAKLEFAHVELGIDPERKVVFLRDDGAGFDMRYVDRLFGAFQRLHSVREFEGTGVGLATVQRIIHRHGGRIWADGAVGHGSTFFFTLGE